MPARPSGRRPLVRRSSRSPPSCPDQRGRAYAEAPRVPRLRETCRDRRTRRARHDRHPDPPDRRDQGRDRSPPPPDAAVHRRRLPRRGGRRAVRDREPGDRPADHGGRAGRAGGRGPRRGGGTTGRRRRSLVAPQPRRPQADPGPLGGADRGQRARARDHRDPGRRQADHRHRRARHAGDRGLHPLARGGDRQALRPGRAVARGHDRDDHPRTGRRRGRGDPVELPGPDGRLEARPGARDRQHGGHQARLDDVAEPAADRGAGRRGRHPRRRAQRRDGPGRHRGRGAGPPSGRGLRGVHRVHRGRATVPDLRRRDEPQAGPARARRQEPAARVRRRRRPRGGRRATWRSRSSGTWARTARRARG